jgi:hypothetical protein
MEGATDNEEEVRKAEEDSPAGIEEDKDDERTEVIRRISTVLIPVYQECGQSEFSSTDSRDEEEEEGMITGHYAICFAFIKELPKRLGLGFLTLGRRM